MSSARHKFEQAYINTDYRVLLPRSALTFRIGEYDAEVEKRLFDHCRIEREWAIITPCNPNSDKADEDANQQYLRSPPSPRSGFRSPR